MYYSVILRLLIATILIIILFSDFSYSFNVYTERYPSNTFLTRHFPKICISDYFPTQKKALKCCSNGVRSVKFGFMTVWRCATTAEADEILSMGY